MESVTSKEMVLQAQTVINFKNDVVLNPSHSKYILGTTKTEEWELTGSLLLEKSGEYEKSPAAFFRLSLTLEPSLTTPEYSGMEIDIERLETVSRQTYHFKNCSILVTLLDNLGDPVVQKSLLLENESWSQRSRYHFNIWAKTEKAFLKSDLRSVCQLDKVEGHELITAKVEAALCIVYPVKRMYRLASGELGFPKNHIVEDSILSKTDDKRFDDQDVLLGFDDSDVESDDLEYDSTASTIFSGDEQDTEKYS